MRRKNFKEEITIENYFSNNNGANRPGGTQGNNSQRPRVGRVMKEELHRINERIRVPEVRLVGGNVEQGVYSTREAMRIADDMGLDLVEISPNANPPVCKIVDYQKFLYQLKKKEKEIKKNSSQTVIKEIRFGPQTDEHDYNFKLKHAQEFIKQGCKIRAYVQFRGRAIVFKEQGEVLLLRLANDLEEVAKVDNMPLLEGKRMSIQLSPKRKDQQGKKTEQPSKEE